MEKTSKTTYIDCAIKRPRMVDFLGLPLHCASQENGKDERVTKEMNIGKENDSFKIRVEMADNADEAGEDGISQSTSVMRNVKSIAFSKLAMTKAFVQDSSANMIIDANKTTVTHASCNKVCNSDISYKRRTQIKIEKMERKVNNKSFKTLTSASESSVKEKKNGIHEKVHENIVKQENMSKQSEITNTRTSGNTHYSLGNDIRTITDSGDMNKDTDQHYDDGDDIDVDFEPYSPEAYALEDAYDSKQKETAQHTIRDENNTNTASDGNMNADIPKCTNEQRTNQNMVGKMTNQTKQGHMISEIQDEHHYKIQAGSNKHIETSEFKKVADKLHPGINQLAAPDNSTSSVFEEMLESETQILEIGEKSGNNSDFKFTVKQKDKRETLIEKSSECCQYRKRHRTKSVDTAQNMTGTTTQTNESPNQKAKYQIIVAKPERKVFFCDMCNMSVHDMLMHKAKHHWF